MKTEKKPKNIIIVNRKSIEKTMNNISKDGSQKLYIVSDFERTLTRPVFKGKKTPSLISVLRDEQYLSSKYSKKGKELFSHYHPFEVNPKISPKEKKKLMGEWWGKHFSLMARFCLNKKHIEKIVNSKRMQLRVGGPEFLDLLKKYDIPLLIISASGLGDYSISMFLKKERKTSSNIYIISNSLKWDKKGNFIGVKKPVIHSANKKGGIVRKLPIFKKIRARKNIILLGDNIEDCQMAEGLDYKNLVKVGFLNSKNKDNLAGHKRAFDVLVLDNGNMNYVNDLLREALRVK
jgi:5'-nucleotidase